MVQSAAIAIALMLELSLCPRESPNVSSLTSHIVSRTVGSGERIEEKMVAFIIAGTILLLQVP